MKLDPPPMAGSNLYAVLYGSNFKFNRRQAIDEVNALTERIKTEYGMSIMDRRIKLGLVG